MRKEFVFSMKLDAADFDRSIAEIQQKLKNIYAPSDIVQRQQQTAQRLASGGMGGIMSQPTQQAYQQATQQAKRDMDQLIAEQARGQEKLGKIIAQRSELLKKLQSQQKEMTKDSQEELSIKEKIARVEGNNYRLRETYRQRDAALNQAMDAKESMEPGGKSMSRRLGRGASILGGVGVAMRVGADAYEQLGRSQFRALSNTGTAMEGVIGRQMQDMQTPYGQSWMQERMRSLTSANDMDRITRRTDLMRIGSGTAMMGAGGMSALAGGPIGWGIGGISAGAGAATLFGNERMRALSSSGILSGAGEGVNNSRFGQMTGGAFGAGNWLKGQGDQQMKEYNSLLAKEFAKNFQTALQAEQETNPLKKLAAQTYSENYMNYLQTQRSLGLNYNTFHAAGGFREKTLNAGFTDQLAGGMSQEILGAGGSTRMGRESTFGLQLQRNMGMTNAGQLLGTLSGGIGNAEATKQATIKILAEGMKLGLDDSKFAEENRKFSMAVAEIIARSGATTGADFGRLSEGFGRFNAENTTRGLEAAQGAYQEFQQLSSTTTGPRGMQQAAGLLGDPELKKLSVKEKQALMKIPDEELNSDNMLLQSLASKAEIPVSRLIEIKRKAVQGSVSRFKETDVAVSRLRDQKVDMSKINDPEFFSTLTDQQKEDVGTILTNQAIEYGYKNKRMMMSRFKGTVTGQVPKTEEEKENDEVEDYRNQIFLNTKARQAPEKPEDKTIQNMAESSRLALSGFQQFHKELTPSVETIRNFNTMLQNSIKIMKDLSPENRNIFERMFGVQSSQNQEQGGKQQK